MKILYILVFLIFLAVSHNALTQEQYEQQKYRLQLAREGCQKPIGFIPTPSKVMCLLTAFGKSDKEIKSKALAIVFTVCRGYTFQPLPTGITAKKYSNLGNCLKDPTAIKLINNELKARGFPMVKVVNKEILSASTTNRIYRTHIE